MIRRLGFWLAGGPWISPERLRTDLDERVEAVEERFDGLEQRVKVLEQHERKSDGPPGYTPAEK